MANDNHGITIIPMKKVLIDIELNILIFAKKMSPATRFPFFSAALEVVHPNKFLRSRLARYRKHTAISLLPAPISRWSRATMF